MWMCRYITRCVKEAVDKSRNVFHCRTIHGQENETVYNPNNGDCTYIANCINTPDNDGTGQTKREFSGNACFPRNLVQALSCSTAMMMGWCAGQIICLHERSSKLKCCRRCDEYGTFNTVFANSYKKIVPLSLILKCTVLAQPVNLKTVPIADKKPEPEIEQKHIDDTDTVNEKLSLEERIGSTLEQFQQLAGNLENQFGTACIENSEPVASVQHFEAGTLHLNAAAAFNLGLCYELGIGTKKDFEKAAECYKVATELGNTKAMYNLAVYYAQGLGGLSIDFNKARILFTQAAAKGHKESIRALSSDPDCEPVPIIPLSNTVPVINVT